MRSELDSSTTSRSHQHIKAHQQQRHSPASTFSIRTSSNDTATAKLTAKLLNIKTLKYYKTPGSTTRLIKAATCKTIGER